MSETLDTRDKPVFSYILASADMRYIENGERQIFLRNHPEAGLIFRGELAECGPGCYVDLSQVLLEYAVSCEGCKEEGVGVEQARRFGEHLAEVLTTQTGLATADLPDGERLSIAMKHILDSINTKYENAIQEDQIEFSLSCCPLTECGGNSGANIGIDKAYISFMALCKGLIKTLAPDWAIQEHETQIPIRTIRVATAEHVQQPKR